jgi:predicted metalloprotease with PDZ domain
MTALKRLKQATPLLMSLLLVFAAGTALARDKDQERGYLGVKLQNVSASMAKALQLGEGEGVMINEVVDGGPAEKAGLEDGDVILKFSGQAINDYAALTKAVRAASPGDKVKIEILRGGRHKTVEVELGKGEEHSFTYTISRDEDGDSPHVEFFGDDGEHENIWVGGDGEEGMKKMHLGMLGEMTDRGYLGVELGDLNEQLGEYFGVADGKGALVNSVRQDSPAAKAGLKAGDVITGVNGETVADGGEVHAAMADTKPGQEVEVKFVRKGSSKTQKITAGEMPEGEFSFNVRAPHAPGLMKQFKHRFDVKDGDEDIRVLAPGAHPKLRKIRHFQEDGAEMRELRSQMDELRQELRELQAELKK